ncbi:10698_t:CDS:10 [Diversispora eburnea]|uniref:10698_t:CDS:1 n=1 Tax=Diversispora eburnea TaxID=1213867 RepID=A0A9N9B397_9GLOM|nr:10698_t:CDS:10 [Diversispora eburnea]
MQKDKLGQDIFLIGPPGNLRRGIVLKYAQLTNREIEYIPLSKDCTDADLKQRREILNGTAFYVDQACVRAAINGRILILDGIEKAERNVLPILNNLLENREMALEDGRFLVHPKRYDSLIKTNEKTNMDEWKLVKVSDRFIVMALGLPIPPYIGHPLDPPLRSRFQCRDIKSPGFNDQVKHLSRLAPKANIEILERLVSVGNVIGSMQFDNSGGIKIPEFPISMESSVLILQYFPDIQPRFLLDLLYPWPLLSTCDLEQRNVIETIYHRFGMLGHENTTESKDDNDSVQYEFFVETNYHQNIFNAMLIAHSVGDFCLIGMKGVGKSALVRYFARKLGYNIEYIPLYKDMSARDLLQRRSTTFSGDTIWENSLLVKAAITGNLAIIDGIETLSFGTLVTIQRLIKEREIVLPDGKQLINYMRYKRLIQDYGFTEKQLKSKGILAIHPAFRIVALARPFSSSEGESGSWLSPEIVSMFQFLVVRPLNNQEEAQVLKTLSPGIDSENLSLLLRFAHLLRNDTDETIKSISNALSTRQLIRICRRLTLFPRESLYETIHKVSLSRFLPSLAKEALEELMINNGILSPSNPINISQLKIEILPSRDDPKILRIGDVEQPISKESNPLLIPNVLFHENPQQTYILMQILQDYQLGEHLLLIGNQGVGKNKLADYFLQLLRLPREYIQLHRDTTVQRYILVVDEADKAPTYVTAVLRNLLEDGQMVLSDGRRIISNLSFNKNSEGEDKEKEECIVIHRNFRMIVLANRPGFPFLGNDFYREIGDVFSCHAVDNPDSDSEMFLLKKYAPDVSEDLLLRLTAVFNDLRKLVDEGLISYPYSTRELVNVVKHMQQFPDEGVSRILQNVFDFDQYDKDSKDLLIATFQKHEIPVGLESDFTVNLGTRITLSDPIISEYWTRSNNITEDKICDVKKEILALRGRWEIQVGRPRELDRIESRTVTFTEQVYNFRIPTRGEAIDIVGLEDGSLFAVTTNPVALHAIDKEHHKILSIDLYEYFPLQEAPPRIKISIIKLPNEQNNELWHLLLHNSSDNSLLCIDFATKNVMNTTSAFIQKISLTGLSPTSKSIMVNNFDYMEILECLDGQYYIIHAIPNENNQIRVPNILQKIDVHGFFKDFPEEITYVSSSGVFARPTNDILSVRFLQNTNDSMANVSLFLSRTGQLATIIPLKDGRSEGYLELFNPIQNTLWRIIIPLAFNGSRKKSNPGLSNIDQQFEKDAAILLELPNGNLLTMDNSGIVRVWQVDPGQLIKAANIWRKLGKITQETAAENLLGTGSGSGSSGGGGDPMNLKGRNQTFIDVANLQVRTEAAPPRKLTDIQREIHEMTMQKKLEQVNMTQSDSELYHSYLINVQREIRELRVILGSIEAKNKERIWLKNQSSGDVDDTKLIEGLTGDINIYKRRGENDDEIEFFQTCIDLTRMTVDWIVLWK